MKGYAHRSTNDFKPEPLQYGTGTKPQCKLSEEEYKLVEIIPNLMEKQRSKQKAIPEAERVYIGGEIFALHLTDKGCWSFKIGQFEDCQQDRDYLNNQIHITCQCTRPEGAGHHHIGPYRAPRLIYHYRYHCFPSGW